MTEQPFTIYCSGTNQYFAGCGWTDDAERAAQLTSNQAGQIAAQMLYAVETADDLPVEVLTWL